MTIRIKIVLFIGLGMFLAGSSADAQGKIQRLVEALGDEENYNASLDAYNALRNLKNPKVIPHLVRALPGYTTRCQTLGMYIIEMFPDSLSHPALRKLLRSNVPYLKLQAAVYLYRAGDTRVAREISEALESEKTPANLSVMFSRLNYTEDEQVMSRVRSIVVKENDLEIRYTALRYLLRVNDVDAKPIVERFLEEPDLTVDHRSVYAAFLYRLGDTGYSRDVAQALRSEDLAYTDFTRIYSFLITASHLEDEILEAIVELLGKEVPSSFLSTSLYLLNKFPTKNAVSVLRPLLNHKSENVARAAMKALSAIPGGLAVLADLDPSDPREVLLRADALRKKDDLSAFSAVLDLVKKGDENKAEAVRVLSGFRLNAAVPPLIDALSDERSRVRYNAYHGLRTLLGSLFPYRYLNLQTTGYDPNGSEESRMAGAAMIRAWWEANHGKGW